MRRIVLVGNHQMRMLCAAYNRFIAPAAGEVAQFVAGMPDSDAARAAIAAADAVVLQVSDPAAVSEADALPGPAERHLVPFLAADFLWPFIGQPHPHNKRLPNRGGGPYPAQLGDRYLNELIAQGIDPEEAVARYLDLDVPAQVDLDRGYAGSIAAQRARDAAAGYDFATAIERTFRKQSLFLAPQHPNLPLARQLALELFQRMGAGAAALARLKRDFVLTELPWGEPPIHPAVARHFKLRFLAKDQRYRYFDEGSFTFAQSARRYMRFEWNEPLNEGIELARGADKDAALAKLCLGLEISPRSAAGHAELGSLLAHQGDLDQARGALNKAVAIEPTHPGYRARLGHVFIRLGRLADAERQAREAVALAPENAGLHRGLSDVLARQDRLADAIAAARIAVEVEPAQAHSRAHLAHLLARAGKLAQAEQELRAAVALAPRQGGFHRALSDVLMRQERLPDAIAAARTAVELEPGQAHARAYLAHLLERAGDLAGAERELSEAIALAPDQAGPHSNLARVLARQDRLAEALAAARTAVALDPGQAHFRSQLGHFLTRSGALEEAAQEVAQAVALAPEHGGFHFHLSELLARQGRLAEAIERARSAAELQPAHAPTRSLLDRLLALAAQAQAGAEAQQPQQPEEPAPQIRKEVGRRSSHAAKKRSGSPARKGRHGRKR